MEENSSALENKFKHKVEKHKQEIYLDMLEHSVDGMILTELLPRFEHSENYEMAEAIKQILKELDDVVKLKD
jgi:hypothetical protein